MSIDEDRLRPLCALIPANEFEATAPRQLPCITREISPARLLAAHRNIVEGLRNRDFAEARRWMERHMADFRRGWEYAGLELDEVVHSPTQP